MYIYINAVIDAVRARLKYICLVNRLLVATWLTCFVLSSTLLKDPPIFVWSDSLIVLHWAKSQKQLPPFVHHHINEIQSTLPTAEWRYCPTLENPADLLTRGITTDTLISSSIWQIAYYTRQMAIVWSTTLTTTHCCSSTLTTTHCCSSSSNQVCSSWSHHIYTWSALCNLAQSPQYSV